MTMSRQQNVNSAQHQLEQCLAVIHREEPRVQAWQFLDEGRARSAAEQADRAAHRGALHGLPVGIKDIIDTAGMPTENGTVLHVGRVPSADAAVVAALKSAGAVIVGKTVTTELATYAPGKTRNPHDTTRTPGGSSSGSAAAVAAGMVPVAIGTQTNGSVIRPASFCGLFGFKPTHGAISTAGILRLSPTLDTVGVFANGVEEIERVAGLLAGFGPAQPFVPRFAFVKTHLWDRVEPDAREAFDDLASRLGGGIEDVALPPWFPIVWEHQKTIMECEMAFNLQAEWDGGRERLSVPLQGQLTRGRSMSAMAYQEAVGGIATATASLDAIFDRFDAILTPATPGVAPPAETTGDPSFCTPWSYCGTPAINVPLLRGEGGLPVGVQLVARRGNDARLLRAADWLMQAVSGHAGKIAP